MQLDIHRRGSQVRGVLEVRMVLVVQAVEEPAVAGAVMVAAAHDAILERDVPLVSIPMTIGPPAAGTAPRSGGLRDRAVRNASPGRRDVHGASVFHRNSDRNSRTTTTKHLSTLRTLRTPRTTLRCVARHLERVR